MVQLNETSSGGESLVLERRVDGRLWARINGAEHPVRVHRCFPWSEPGRFLSLRDGENQEVAMVTEKSELDLESQEALEGALVEAGFVLCVTRIQDVDEEVEIRTWKVETEQGPRSFQTKLDDWPLSVPGGGVVIRDVAGDLYHVAEPDATQEREDHHDPFVPAVAVEDAQQAEDHQEPGGGLRQALEDSPDNLIPVDGVADGLPDFSVF